MSHATPVLNAIQRAWLQEIGIDARMLAHFSAEPLCASEPAEVTARAGDAPGAPAAVTAPAPLKHGAPAPGERATGPLAPVAELLKRGAVAAPPSARPLPVLQPGAGVRAVSTLDALREHAAGCAACGLYEVRSRTVFGEGVEQAPRWMFIGEAPGEYDESAGRPFQGRAGELLQAMLRSIGLDAEAPIYFTNVLKCRPMGNRSPEAAEIEACLPLLRRQIGLLRPGCLVALGRVSAGALLGRDGELDELRGQVHQYIDDDGRSIPLVVTHHPASLLLHAQYKADAWRDLNLLGSLGA